jgi:hypothetical protein
MSGADLDVPRIRTSTKALGNEDEENNYYNIGGDNHNDLERK